MKKAADKELTAALKATGTTLTSLEGIGPSGAARLLVEAGDITRFPAKGHFASWNGTAPIDASSGDHVRHRLSRAGNRQINRVLHIMAGGWLRHATKGRAYYDRKVAAGKTPMEAMRCLKRRLSDVVFRQMKTDARTTRTGPGGPATAVRLTLKSGNNQPLGTEGSHESVLKADPGFLAAWLLFGRHEREQQFSGQPSAVADLNAVPGRPDPARLPHRRPPWRRGVPVPGCSGRPSSVLKVPAGR